MMNGEEDWYYLIKTEIMKMIRTYWKKCWNDVMFVFLEVSMYICAAFINFAFFLPNVTFRQC